MAEFISPPFGVYSEIFWQETTDSSNNHDDYPYISQQTFRQRADHVFDETGSQIDPTKVKAGDIIYINNAYLPFFFEKIYPYLKNSFVLISMMTDKTLPGEFLKFLDDEKIIAWFSTNADVSKHYKMNAIPIGIPYSICHSNSKVREDYLLNFKDINKSKKKHLVIFNSRLETNIIKRKKVYDFFSKKNWCYKPPIKNYNNYFEDMKNSIFVIAPPGNGLDCFRMWEALMVGCYPIIESSFLDPLYDDLPVVIVKDWSSVNTKFLFDELKKIKNKTINLEKLKADYWLNKIKQYTKSDQNLNKK